MMLRHYPSLLNWRLQTDLSLKLSTALLEDCPSPLWLKRATYLLKYFFLSFWELAVTLKLVLPCFSQEYSCYSLEPCYRSWSLIFASHKGTRQFEADVRKSTSDCVFFFHTGFEVLLMRCIGNHWISQPPLSKGNISISIRIKEHRKWFHF